MTRHNGGLDGAGAEIGDTVRCTGMRDDHGNPYFIRGSTYKVEKAPNGEPCVWTTLNTRGADPYPMRGYGFFFEVMK